MLSVSIYTRPKHDGVVSIHNRLTFGCALLGNATLGSICKEKYYIIISYDGFSI